MADEEQDEVELQGEDLKNVKEARAAVQKAIQHLNAVPDDTAEAVYQVVDSVGQLENVVSLLDEVIPDTA